MFLTKRFIKFVINRFTNPWQHIETDIPKGLLVFPILFLVYISKVFSAVDIKLPNVTFVLFIDDRVFLISDSFINLVATLLEKAKKKILQ